MADIIRIKDESRGEEIISINFSKLREKAKACKEKIDNAICKRELKELGIDWV